MKLHLNAIDIAILVATLAATLFVGIWSGRRVTSDSAKGYFLASGRMPWWIIGSAFVSTSVSSEQIIGTVGAAYSHGMGIANWEWFALPINTLLIAFFIPIYLKNKVATVSELLNRRFGPLCADLYSWVMLLAYVFVFLTPVLYGSSLAISALTGFNFYAVLWLTVAGVGAYAIKGGLSAVMWTDAIQCLFLIVGGMILFFVALSHVPGGWGAMQAAAPERFHLYHPPSDEIAPFLGLVMGAVGVFLFYNAGNQVMVQRVLAARTPWDGIMGIIFAGFINLVRPLVTCFLGFIVYHWTHVMKASPVLENADMAFPFALQNYAPSWGLRGIVLAGFMAAVMSTVSALSNSAATVFSLDVYQKFVRREASDKQLVLVGRAASAVTLILAGLCAPSIARLGGIFEFFQTGVTYLATPFISVLLMGILWRRTNYTGAIAGIIGGLVIQVGLALANGRLSWNLHWLYVAFAAQVLTMCLTAIVSALSRDTRTPQTDAFIWTPSLLGGLMRLSGRPWYQSAGLWFGVYAALWVTLYYYFW
jgi:SSS family solute:Na+ symporter